MRSVPRILNVFRRRGQKEARQKPLRKADWFSESTFVLLHLCAQCKNNARAQYAGEIECCDVGMQGRASNVRLSRLIINMHVHVNKAPM